MMNDATLTNISHALMAGPSAERLRAVERLGRRGGRACVPTLLNLAAEERNPVVVRAMARLVRELGTPRQVGLLLLRQQTHRSMRERGLGLLVQYSHTQEELRETAAIAKVWCHANLPRHRALGVEAYAKTEPHGPVPFLLELLAIETDADVVRTIVSRIEKIGDADDFATALVTQTLDPAWRQKGLAMQARAHASRHGGDVRASVLPAPSPEATTKSSRVEILTARLRVEGAAMAAELVYLAQREHDPAVLDFIIEALRQVGTPKQLGMALFTQELNASLHEEGLQVLIRHAGNGAARESLYAYVNSVIVNRMGPTGVMDDV